MADVSGALLAVVLIIGVVMLGVAAMAWFGVRYSDRTLSARAMRRLAWFNVGVGMIALSVAVWALLMGTEASLSLIFLLLQGIFFTLFGVTQLRALNRASQTR